MIKTGSRKIVGTQPRELKHVVHETNTHVIQFLTNVVKDGGKLDGWADISSETLCLSSLYSKSFK